MKTKGILKTEIMTKALPLCLKNLQSAGFDQEAINSLGKPVKPSGKDYLTALLEGISDSVAEVIADALEEYVENQPLGKSAVKVLPINSIVLGDGINEQALVTEAFITNYFMTHTHVSLAAPPDPIALTALNLDLSNAKTSPKLTNPITNLLKGA